MFLHLPTLVHSCLQRCARSGRLVVVAEDMVGRLARLRTVCMKALGSLRRQTRTGRPDACPFPELPPLLELFVRLYGTIGGVQDLQVVELQTTPMPLTRDVPLPPLQ